MAANAIHMTSGLWQALQRARDEVGVLAGAFRHPGTPWYAKAWLLVVVSYAVSPIDLIPDFIPVLGLVDDAILLPLGIILALRMIPADVMQECRAAHRVEASGRLRMIGVAIVVVLWIVALVGSAWFVRRVV